MGIEESAVDGAVSRAETEGRRRPSRTAAVIFLGVLVLALGAWAVVRVLHLDDPYRPGTSHRVTVTYQKPCLNATPLFLDGWRWGPRGVTPDAWQVDAPSNRGVTEIPGTLEVTTEGRATFTADQGGTLAFEREAQSRFSDLTCAIR